MYIKAVCSDLSYDSEAYGCDQMVAIFPGVVEVKWRAFNKMYQLRLLDYELYLQ